MNDDIPKIYLKEWVDIRIQRGDDIPSIEDEINWISIIYDAESYMTFYVVRSAHLLGEVYDEVMTERVIINTNYTPLAMIIDPQNCKSTIEYIKEINHAMRELSPYEWMELCLRGNLSRSDIISHIDYISSDREHYLALYPDHEGRLFLINQNDTYINVSKVKEHKEDILRLICL